MKSFLVTINPIDVALWTLRRKEKDVVNLYDSLSPVMMIATGGSMLNFGYWTEKNNEPIKAQENLCRFLAKTAELENAKTAVDLGSGLSAPALLWRNTFENLRLFCVNINFKQLQFTGTEKNLEFVNSTATKLPFMTHSVDRVLALESSQHFKPFQDFLIESKRILKDSGILVMALPVLRSVSSIQKLGILNFTWSSEHYNLNFIKSQIHKIGFSITDEFLIGNKVYIPLADYYIQNRDNLKNHLKQKYPGFVEKILFQSIKKMKKASEDQIIDYAILKCRAGGL